MHGLLKAALLLAPVSTVARKSGDVRRHAYTPAADVVHGAEDGPELGNPDSAFLPDVPWTPAVPDVPDIPVAPDMPNMPDVPEVSDANDMPGAPGRHSEAEPSDAFDFELAEFQFLLQQKAELEEMIAFQELRLAEEYGWSPYGGDGECHGLKCLVENIVEKVSDAAMSFYEDITGVEDMHDGPGHGKGPWWRHPKHPKHPKHGKPGKPHCPGKFPHHGWPHHGNHSHHGNHTHGNHTFPHPPPWRRPHKFPHHPPPFCRCPPPPHRDGPQHPPPPPPPPGHPPHRGGPQDPPPPPPPDHPPHRGPPHRKPGDDGRRPPPPDKDETPDFADDEPDSSSPPWTRPPPTHPDDHGIPPPPPHDHQGGPPPHHGPPRHHTPLPLKIAAAFALFIVVFALHRRVHGKYSSCMARREAHRRRRADRRQFVKRLLFGPWLPRCDADAEEEEKEAMLQHHEEEETSMEEELASCRMAADVVGDIVAAEEGRALLAAQDGNVTASGRAEVTAVAQPSFVHYVEEDVEEEEVLPAYDERSDSSIADGMRYTPGSSAYTPSSSGSDELGDRKY